MRQHFVFALASFTMIASNPAQAISRRTSLGAVADTNRSARISPDPHVPGSAARVYPWSDGGLFSLFTTPGIVSDIALEPGETLVAVAAGDTARWVVGDTQSGEGDAKQVHVLIKPVATGLATNLLITTTKRTYHLELTSSAHTAMSQIRWTYPVSALLSLKSPLRRDEDQPPTLAAVSSSKLNFDYTISGDHPAWRPMLAFDDGQQTFIKFPASLAANDAPPLFVVGAKGEAQLVNYRVQDSLYVVDQLFDAAELRLGTKKQKIVRIARVGTSQKRADR